jgi:hypothetical protein
MLSFHAKRDNYLRKADTDVGVTTHALVGVKCMFMFAVNLVITGTVLLVMTNFDQVMGPEKILRNAFLLWK